MKTDEIVNSLRSCADLVKQHKLDACAAVMNLAAGALESAERFKIVERNGFAVRYNEDSGEWDEYKVYITIDCQSEEDFQYLKNCVDKQQEKEPCEIVDEWGMGPLSCPSCGNSVINYFNKKIKPPHCMMCGQKLLWKVKHEKNRSI